MAKVIKYGGMEVSGGDISKQSKLIVSQSHEFLTDWSCLINN